MVIECRYTTPQNIIISITKGLILKSFKNEGNCTCVYVCIYLCILIKATGKVNVDNFVCSILEKGRISILRFSNLF